MVWLCDTQNTLYCLVDNTFEASIPILVYLNISFIGWQFV